VGGFLRYFYFITAEKGITEKAVGQIGRNFAGFIGEDAQSAGSRKVFSLFSAQNQKSMV